MTTEELKYAASVMLAAAEPGAVVEFVNRYYNTKKWVLTTNPTWNWHEYDYRIDKPPGCRPWKPEEVPLGGRLRRKDNHNIRGMITHVDGNVNVGVHYYNLHDLFDQFEGLDGSPCGVLES